MAEAWAPDSSGTRSCAPSWLREEIVGIRAILVHAISETAKAFYEKYGFIPSPVDPLTVMITVAEAARITA